MKTKLNSCLRIARVVLLTLCLLAGVRSVSAFALLGPFAPWMTRQLSYQDGVSIGGPMNIGEGYRWNVPVITYGYDQSFLDFFGTNGVAAVDSAIAILNNLPPASQIDLSTFPLTSFRVNYNAQYQNLIDLKSYALTMLLEQMGLTQPDRYVFSLQDFTLTNGTANYTMLTRNFDPVTWQPSTSVNGASYAPAVVYNFGYEVVNSYYYTFSSYVPLYPMLLARAEGVLLDPTQQESWSAIADSSPAGWYNGGDSIYLGRFCYGLTRDDAGGLAYLLNSNNVALESVIPGVQGAGTNISNFVNTALRPGVEKITFQRVDYISPAKRVFPVLTNFYTDSYFTNGVLQQQTLQRVITQPDILFTAQYVSGLHIVSRSGTTNWINNGGPGHNGPGVIQPPVQINFGQLGPSLEADGNYPPSSPSSAIPTWASFDATTNPPVNYPILTTTNRIVFHLVLGGFGTLVLPKYNESSWALSGQPGALFSLQTSVDLQNWTTIGTITNLGGTYTYSDYAPTNTPQRYFRTVPQ